MLSTPQLRMTKKAQRAAEALAVRYHAYLDSNRIADYSGIVIWGQMLRDAQIETGIVLIRPERLNHHIEISLVQVRKMEAA